MAGVSIASVTAAAEAIAAAAAPWPIEAVLRAVVAAGLFAPAVARFAATQELITPAERVPAVARPQRLAPAAVVDRTRRQRVAAVVVVMPAAVAADTPAAAVADMQAVAVVVVVMLVAAAADTPVVTAADTGNLNAASSSS
jgi:hypothetical protein